MLPVYNRFYTMYAIISNYGNDAIALLQWAADAKLAPVYVIYVETNWHAPEWPARVAAGETYARSLDFQIVHLVPPLQFPDLITEKNSFPTPKFAWCAGILKGLPILEWLDTHDSPAEATVILGTRQQPNQPPVPEMVEASPHWGDRRVWQPLYQLDDLNRNALLAQTSFPLLAHRSLECDPCIYTTHFTRLSPAVVQRTALLEQLLGDTMFGQPIQRLAQIATDTQDVVYMGCGIPFGCGI
jgi:hypothetical protein